LIITCSYQVSGKSYTASASITINPSGTCSKYSNYQLTNSSSLDFVKLNELYPNQIIFIGSDIQQFQFFINKTGLNIPFLEVSTFYELSTIIHSCKLFVGSLSSPLSIAHACHKDRIIGLVPSTIDRQLNENLTELWPNARYDL
jgi:ADP-heptose:LPS heptosyltransferase